MQNTTASRLPSEVFDRLPPQSLEAEQGVIGSLILDPRLIGDIAGRLQADDFYADANRRLFQVLLGMEKDGVAIDALTLIDRLKELGQYEAIGGPAYLAEITQNVPVSAHAKWYAAIVGKKSQYRTMIHAATEIIRQAYVAMETPEEILATAESSLRAIKTGQYKSDPVAMDVATIEALLMVDAIMERKSAAGVTVGFPKFDQLVGGVFPGELTILGGRPGQGKTSLAMQMGYNVATKGRKVYFATLEMSRAEVALRNLCSLAGVSNQRVRNGSVTAREVGALRVVAEEQARATMELHDWPTIRAYDIARAARHCGAELIIVDYLQYVTAADKTMKRYEQVGQISRDLKAVARDLKVPVIACAQLNRQVDQSGKENRPRLSHLRESGDIENNADVVLLLFRPEGGITGKKDTKFAGDKWDADLDIAKNRNGRTDRLRLNWTPSFTRFECKDAPDIQQDGEYAGDFAGFSGEPDGEEF